MALQKETVRLVVVAGFPQVKLFTDQLPSIAFACHNFAYCFLLDVRNVKTCLALRVGHYEQDIFTNPTAKKEKEGSSGGKCEPYSKAGHPH